MKDIGKDIGTMNKTMENKTTQEMDNNEEKMISDEENEGTVPRRTDKSPAEKKEKDKEEDKSNSQLKKIYINKQGVLIEYDREAYRNSRDKREKGNDRYERDFQGYKVVYCRLTSNNVSTKKGINRIKMMNALHKITCFPDNFEMEQFNLASVKFKNMLDANVCLERINKELKELMYGYIDNRSVSCRGVIADWPYGITELWEALVKKEEIMQLERMTRKKFDKDSKTVREVETDNIIVTMKGNKLQDNLVIYEGIGRIRIRPFIDAVRQCYKCYRFGHTKVTCKSIEKCAICGGDAHGECKYEVNCRNCEGAHRSTYKGCPVFQKNREIKVTMAYNNVSFYEAVKILEGKERIHTNEYDRFVKPSKWPELHNRYANAVTQDANVQKPLPKNNTEVSLPRRIVSPEDRQEGVGRRSMFIKPRTPTRNNEPNRNSRREDKKDNNQRYYAKFNTRNEEITRDKRGIALSGTDSETEEERTKRKKRRNTQEWQENKKIFMEKVAKLVETSEDFKNLLFAITEEEISKHNNGEDYNQEGRKESYKARGNNYDRHKRSEETVAFEGKWNGGSMQVLGAVKKTKSS